MVRGCASLAAEGNALLLLELAMEEVEVFWRRRIAIFTKTECRRLSFAKAKGRKKKRRRKNKGFIRVKP
jgi:hypothetical protein